MILNLKDRIWDILILFFIVLLVVWGIKRAKYDLRWSAWASADAQNLNAANHFAEDGFKKHFFLPYLHPGYLGKSFGTESKTGYYTHYPPLSNIFLGIQIRLFGNNRTILKSVTVLFSGCTILLCYLTFVLLFNKRIAFFSTLFIGSSIGFLQFIDCLSPYMFSEFSRFTILFFFILSEKYKDHQIKSSLLTGVTWILLFLESLNSLDYYFFYQLFFWIYAFLNYPKHRFPYKKLLLLASAPFVGYGLHYWNVLRALKYYHESGLASFQKGFMDKIIPIHKGLLPALSFIFYFLRTMNSHMINHNFGIGFGFLFLMIGINYLLVDKLVQKNNSHSDSTRLSLTQTFILFGIPSISWWTVFPNHSASFFYTPMHLFPLVGVAFGLCLNSLIELLKNEKESKAYQLGILFIFIGLLFPSLLKTSKYISEYPNLLDPSKNVTVGELQSLRKEEIIEITELAKRIKKHTMKGDILLVPRIISDNSNFFEYYSQRRTDGYGDESIEDLKNKIEEINLYKQWGSKKFEIFNPNLKLYCLLKKDSPLLEYASTHYSIRSTLEDWTLFEII